MSKTIYNKEIYAYNFRNIELLFRYKNTVIYSTERETNVRTVQALFEGREFELVSSCIVEEHESAIESKRHMRSDVLTILGIVTYFVGIPLTVYHKSTGQSSIIEEFKVPDADNKLIIEGVDYTDQLNKILDCLKEDNGTVISLLDRWRKANYLEEESCDANLYHDESILNYFHIIELISEISGKKQKDILKNSVSDYIGKFYKDYYFFNENQLQSQVNSVKKVATEILIGRDLTLSHKIKYYLSNVGMYDQNVGYFIDEIIKTRNAIAHGRLTFQDKVLWPLPPFFCLANDSYETLSFLKFFTGRLIACYIGIDCWREEWEEAKMLLMPPETVFDDFLNNIEMYTEVSSESMTNVNIHNITWETVFKHYIGNTKKFGIDRLSNALKEMFLECDVSEENAGDLFNISVVFADSEDVGVQEKAIKNVLMIIEKQWYLWSNKKDVYGYLDYYKLTPSWYLEYLNS